MEQKHVNRINLLCDLIVPQVHIKALWPYLFINGIFNYDDCNVPNWSQNIPNPEAIRDIISTIKTKGPYAYYDLLRSLRQSDQEFSAEILDMPN